ncbi:unnamed protein product [Mytilus edulis]|uniref:C1q domain-containing protein n=1 Tax=Mytilus edulis TaxID=6550 RepID=A0A8S3QA93_MYTED|nr:unnamed protein product [Mytilus edulis]
MWNFWKILAISLTCYAGYAFLIYCSTGRPNSGSQYLTTRHYVQLMDSLYEEKQARYQLEQSVAMLQTKIDAMNNNGGHQAINITTYIQQYISRLEKQEKELKAVQTKDTEIAKLSTIVTDLELNYTRLLHDSLVTQANYHRQKLEVERLKEIKNLDVVNDLREIKDDINMLKASNRARSEDILAFFQFTGSAVDTKIKDLNDKLSRLEMSQNLISLQVNSNVKKVGFTATNGHVIVGSFIVFRDISTSYGLTMCSEYSGGIFRASIPGYYLITVNILANADAGFSICYNTNAIVFAVVNWNGKDKGFHSATASAFVKVSVGDTVSVVGFRIVGPIGK